ncbi:MAG TPA: hypothetical protein VKC15_16110 [Gemmatimonadales bacterium]|nr:hypothetical protein [Gemmatimonadales bacterium]
MSDSPNGNGTPRNPRLKRVAAKAEVVAAAEKVEAKAHDEVCLVAAEIRTTEREIAQSPLTESGLAVPQATLRRLERASRQYPAAVGRYQEAADAVRRARGELFAAEKAAQQWDEHQAHLARQAAAAAAEDAQLTARQRAVRDARRVLDAEGVLR